MGRKKGTPINRGNLDIDPDVLPVANASAAEPVVIIVSSSSDRSSLSDLPSSSSEERPVRIPNARHQASKRARSAGGGASRPSAASRIPAAARGGAGAIQIIDVETSSDESDSASVIKQIWSFANLTFEHEDFVFLQKHFDPSMFCIAFVVVDAHGHLLPAISVDADGYCYGISCKYGLGSKVYQPNSRFVLSGTSGTFPRLSLEFNSGDCELSTHVIMCLNSGLLSLQHGIWSSQSSRFIFPLLLDLVALADSQVGAAGKHLRRVLSEYRPQQFSASDEANTRPLPVDQILEFICRRPDEHFEPPADCIAPLIIPGISTSLKAYQREAVAWARCVEAGTVPSYNTRDLVVLPVQCSVTQREVLFDPVLCQVAAPSGAATQSNASAISVAQSVASNQPRSREQLEALAVVELRSICRSHEILTFRQTKQELIDQLMQRTLQDEGGQGHQANHAAVVRTSHQEQELFGGDAAAAISVSESFRVSGGMLCDEMGLGKTLECLALVILTRNLRRGAPVMPSVQNLSPQSQSLKPDSHFRCVCGQNDVCSTNSVQCENCLYWLHTKCIESFDKDLPYFCLSCRTHVRSPLESDCTLIISPSSISGQWKDEVLKHVNVPDFKCIVYDSSCSLDPFVLAAADLVITTYEVLRKDFHHRNILSKQLRHERRFISCKTPLLGVAWKRVILDEAQMVESSTAMASEMACDLVSKYRWCVTGTPVLRGLSDIEGLMTFLRVPLFCEKLYWKSRIEQPISRGETAHMENVFRFLRSLCWRTSMAEAIARNELNIPPPEQHLRLHELRTIERVFYSRQHDTCMAKAREVLAVCRQRGWTELDSSMAADAMRPLLLLRQACCHPQVGSSWLRSSSGPNRTLGMHEILAQVQLLLFHIAAAFSPWKLQPPNRKPQPPNHKPQTKTPNRKP
jgi:hypothetical protein